MKDKLEKLFSQLPDGSALIVTDSINRRYITGFDCEDSMLAVTADKALYITDFRYLELAERHFEGTGTELAFLAPDDQLSALRDFVVRSGAQVCLLEEASLTVSSWRRLKELFGDFPLKDAGAALANLRAVKSDAEIACIERAQSFAEKAFSKTLGIIKPGITERDIMVELEYHMLRFGAEHTSFETIIASGPNSSVPHARVTDRKIESGEFITMDFGAKYGGYCSDMTRTVAVGKPDAEQLAVYGTVQRAQRYAIENIQAGITGREADSFARELITANGYGECFGHGLGHGVGLFIHESPRLSKLSQNVLLENMVVTVEPGIYIKNRMGVRIEDMLVVKPGGSRNLTSITTELIIL